jgi:hypothetical protein
MDLGAILLLLALLLGVGLFLAAPLMRSLPSSSSQETREASSLMAERDRVINALQELDFDYKLGKVPEEDYPGQRRTLLQRGADILRKLDELEPPSGPAQPPRRAHARIGRPRRRAERQLRRRARHDGSIYGGRRRRAKSAGSVLAVENPSCHGPVLSKLRKGLPRCSGDVDELRYTALMVFPRLC